MTTYTMNGHRHPTMQIHPEILMGIVGNQNARLTRARWQSRTLPEQFSCLESSDPQDQIQSALKQIEALLQENTKLLETVILLSKALSNVHFFIHSDESIEWSDRDKWRLSHGLYRHLEQLREEMQSHALEHKAGATDHR